MKLVVYVNNLLKNYTALEKSVGESVFNRVRILKHASKNRKRHENIEYVSPIILPQIQSKQFS